MIVNIESLSRTVEMCMSIWCMYARYGEWQLPRQNLRLHLGYKLVFRMHHRWKLNIHGKRVDGRTELQAADEWKRPQDIQLKDIPNHDHQMSCLCEDPSKKPLLRSNCPAPKVHYPDSNHFTTSSFSHGKTYAHPAKTLSHPVFFSHLEFFTTLTTYYYKSKLERWISIFFPNSNIYSSILTL